MGGWTVRGSWTCNIRTRVYLANQRVQAYTKYARKHMRSQNVDKHATRLILWARTVWVVWSFQVGGCSGVEQINLRNCKGLMPNYWGLHKRLGDWTATLHVRGLQRMIKKLAVLISDLYLHCVRRWRAAFACNTRQLRSAWSENEKIRKRYEKMRRARARAMNVVCGTATNVYRWKLFSFLDVTCRRMHFHAVNASAIRDRDNDSDMRNNRRAAARLSSSSLACNLFVQDTRSKEITCDKLRHDCFIFWCNYKHFDYHV